MIIDDIGHAAFVQVCSRLNDASPEGQAAIASYTIDGQPLFFSSATL